MRQKMHNSKATLSHRSFCQPWGYFFQEEVCRHKLGTSIPSMLDYIFFYPKIFIYTDTKSISLPSTRVGKKIEERKN